MASNNPRPLCLTIQKDNLSDFSVMVAINPKIDVNERDENFVPVITKVVLDKPVIWLKTLLSNPLVNVNARDREGLTPLMRACASSKREHVKLLLEHPATNADLFTYEHSRSALWYACEKGDLEVLKYLIASGKLLAKTLKGKTGNGEFKIPFQIAEDNKEKHPDAFNLVKSFYLLPNETADSVRKLVKPARIFNQASDEQLYPKDARALFDLFAEARYYVEDRYAIYNVNTVMVRGQLVPLDEYKMSLNPLQVVSLLDVIKAKDEGLPFTYGMFSTLLINKAAE